MTLATVALAVLFASPQALPQSPCATPEHRAFDFWVGNWDVVTPAGKPAGASRVERILDGCVIMENWTGVGGTYEGKSFNTYDAVDRTWTQHWVDTAGASVLLTGGFEGKNLVYRRDFVRRDGKPTKARMTFFNLGDGQVRQLVEHSIDGGRTWTTQVDLTYRRRRG